MTTTVVHHPAESTSASAIPEATVNPLWVALGLALVSGLLEASIAGLQSLTHGGLIDRSRHYVWMIAVADVAFFTLPAVLLLLVGMKWPRFHNVQLVVFVFAVPAVYAVLLSVPRVHWAALLLLSLGIAVQLARVASSHLDGFRALVRRTTPVLGAIVLFVGVVTAGRIRFSELRELRILGASRASAPNVLLIILDTVRAANLSLFGYDRPTSPGLERFARESIVFDRAISTAPWTLPSHASVFTGRFPHELGVSWHVPLDTRYPTLAEALRDQGYVTGGFVANTGYTNTSTGLSRGFTHYEDFRITPGEIVRSSALGRFVADNFSVRRMVRNDEHLNRQPAELITNRFLRWLDQHRDRPFFAFLNYYDAHGPYLPPEPFDRKFGPGRAQGKLSPVHRSNWDPASGHRSLSPAELREEVDAYDGALAHLDQQLDSLFRQLRARGLLDNTIVVLTADHGEEFGEHRVYDHGNSLYFPSVHVPLVIRYPARIAAAQRVAVTVSLRDIPATILDLAGLSTNAAFPGVTLSRFFNANASSATSGLILSEVKYAPGHPSWFPVSKGDMTAVLDAPYRYIRSGDGSEELFDIASDRWEKRNLAKSAEFASELRRLRALAQEGTTPTPGDVSSRAAQRPTSAEHLK